MDAEHFGVATMTHMHSAINNRHTKHSSHCLTITRTHINQGRRRGPGVRGTVLECGTFILHDACTFRVKGYAFLGVVQTHYCMKPAKGIPFFACHIGGCIPHSFLGPLLQHQDDSFSCFLSPRAGSSLSKALRLDYVSNRFNQLCHTLPLMRFP